MPDDKPPPQTSMEEMLQHQRYMARRLFDIQGQIEQMRKPPTFAHIALGVFVGGLCLTLLYGLFTLVFLNSKIDLTQRVQAAETANGH